MASENQIKHKIVISGEQEYKRAMREMSGQLKEAKSEVRATAAEMDAQGKSVETLTARMQALENQREKESDMLREMRRHLEEVVNATGAESEEAVRLRTRINAMRTEIAQTNRQISELTGELDEARDAAEGLGGSGAADGIRSLGDAAQGAEGEMDGILGKLTALGAGFVIGIGAELGKGAVDLITKSVSDAIVDGWNDAVNSRIEYNKLGVKTGTSGTGQNLYMAQLLDQLKLKNPNVEAAQWIEGIAAAYTQFDETTFNNGTRLNGILTSLNTAATGIGTSLPEAVNWVGQMKDVFGDSPEDLAAIYYWIGTSKAGEDGISTMEKYATTWKDIGLSAVGAAGALVLARISGVSNLDAVGKAAKNAEATLLGDEGTLTKLGLEAADLPNKFRAGGEEAKEAMRLLLESFLNADPDTQNELGGKIFGQDNWERYGTRIAEAILGGYETELTPGMKTALEDAEQALTNDLKSQNAITAELKEQLLGEMFAPWESILLAAQTKANEKGVEARNSGKATASDILAEWLAGFVEGAAEGVKAEGERQAAEREAQLIEQYGENWQETLQEEYEEGMERAADEMENRFGVDTRNWIQLYTPDEEVVEAAGEEAGEQTVDAYLAGLSAGAAKRNSTAAPDMTGGEEEDEGETWAEAFVNRMFGGGDAAEEAAEEKGEEAADAVMDAYASGFARNPRMRALDEMELPPIGSAPQTAVDSFLDRLLGTGGVDAVAEAAEEKGEEAGEAALDAWTQGAGEGMDFETVKATVENLNAQIAAAFGAGDTGLAEELTAKRNALIPVLMQLSADAKNTAEDAKEGFDAFRDIEVTIEDTATGAVTKFESGIQPLVPAGQRSVDGLIGVLNGAADPAYTAGWNAGDAFNRGYRDAQGIRSPSRVMQEAAEYSMAGLMAGLESGGSDLERRAAGLSDLLAAGASGAGASAGALTLAGADGADAAALREALTGLVLIMDGEIVGALTERSVSQEGARRAAGTVRGRANGVRSW